MKIGMIGIGLIAKKAYLPVLTQMKDVELHICTRNESTLKEIEKEYKHPYLYADMTAWLESGIEAAFVHAATEAHEYIIDELLDHGIHVYVDKPITAELTSSERLVKKAHDRNLVLMVGFNRRYATSYQQLKALEHPNMLIAQKNVVKAPGDARSFIFNDFIHVIDTILYLFPYQVTDLNVSYQGEAEALVHVSFQLETTGGTAIGIMNRDVGVSYEHVQVMTPSEIQVVENVGGLVSHTKNGVLAYPESTWTPTLKKRGFQNIIQTFIQSVRDEAVNESYNETDLRSHQLAEEIVQEILK